MKMKQEIRKQEELERFNEKLNKKYPNKLFNETYLIT